MSSAGTATPALRSSLILPDCVMTALASSRRKQTYDDKKA